MKRLNCIPWKTCLVLLTITRACLSQPPEFTTSSIEVPTRLKSSPTYHIFGDLLPVKNEERPGLVESYDQPIGVGDAGAGPSQRMSMHPQYFHQFPEAVPYQIPEYSMYPMNNHHHDQLGIFTDRRNHECEYSPFQDASSSIGNNGGVHDSEPPNSEHADGGRFARVRSQEVHNAIEGQNADFPCFAFVGLQHELSQLPNPNLLAPHPPEALEFARNMRSIIDRLAIPHDAIYSRRDLSRIPISFCAVWSSQGDSIVLIRVYNHLKALVSLPNLKDSLDNLVYCMYYSHQALMKRIGSISKQDQSKLHEALFLWLYEEAFQPAYSLPILGKFNSHERLPTVFGLVQRILIYHLSHQSFGYEESIILIGMWYKNINHSMWKKNWNDDVQFNTWMSGETVQFIRDTSRLST